jgi:hypothetical protein
MICGVRTKEFFWTNYTPQNAPVEVYAGERAHETIDGFWCADVGNIVEHPIQNKYLRNRGNDCGDHLNREEDPRWDLHVMAKFKVGREFDALCRGDVSVGNEDHVCDRSTWEDGTADKLADKVDAAVLIRDCHNDTDWNKEDRADAQSEDQTVPWKLYWVAERS